MDHSSSDKIRPGSWGSWRAFSPEDSLSYLSNSHVRRPTWLHLSNAEYQGHNDGIGHEDYRQHPRFQLVSTVLAVLPAVCSIQDIFLAEAPRQISRKKSKAWLYEFWQDPVQCNRKFCYEGGEVMQHSRTIRVSISPWRQEILALCNLKIAIV